MNKKKVSIFIILFLILPIYSQTGKVKKNTELDKLDKIYESAKKRGDYRTALTTAASALKISLKLYGDKHIKTALLNKRVGFANHHLGNYKKANSYYKKALPVVIKIHGMYHEETASLYTNISAAYLYMGDFNRAIDFSMKSLDINLKNIGPDHLETAISYNNLGAAYEASGDHSRAIEYLHKTLKILIKKFGNKHHYIAMTYNNLGFSYYGIGKINRAITFYKEAMAIGIEILGKEHPDVAIWHNNLGMAFYHKGDFKKAINHYRLALTIDLKKMGENHPNVVIRYNNLGRAYDGAGNPNLAIKYYQASLKIGDPFFGKKHPLTATIYSNIGAAYKRKNDTVKAIEYYQKSLSIYKNTMARQQYIIALRDMADIYIANGQIKNACKSYETAIELIKKYRVEIGRGKSLFTAYYIHIFDRLIDVSLRNNMHKKAFHTDMQKRGLSISEGLSLKSALEAGGVIKKEADRLKKLSGEIESMRSKYEMFTDQGRLNEAGTVLDGILKLEREKESLNSKLIRRYPSYAAIRLPKIPSVSDIQKLLEPHEIIISYSLMKKQNTAFVVDKKNGLRLIRLPGVNEPLKNSLKNLYTLFSIPLSKNSPLYRIKTKKGNLLIWNKRQQNEYVNRGGKLYTMMRKSQAGHQIDDKIKGDLYESVNIGTVISLLKYNEKQQIREKLLKKMYSILIEPILSQYPGSKKLVIIPDGPLYYLSFGILKNNNNKMLLETHSIRMIHSPVIWYQLKKRKISKWKHPILTVGNAVYSRGHINNGMKAKRGVARVASQNARKKFEHIRTSFPPKLNLRNIHWNNLPGTGEEVLEISRLAYKNSNERQKHTLIDINANCDRLYKLSNTGQLKKYRYLHFSVHGLFVEGNPQLNALVFSIPEQVKKFKKKEYLQYKKKYGSLKHDSFLQLGEVKGLNIQSELVVLSACETSLGHEMLGEGIVGLPQAFLIAGSRSVIASLWPVDDEETSLLMQNMYRNILIKKMKPADALKKAKLELKKEIPDPYFWSGFVFYGE